MTVIHRVMQLVAAKGFGVVNFQQYVTAPGRSIGLDVTDACFGAAPIASSRECLEGDIPSLVEFRFRGSPILEAL
jgi:hypothetical protein